MTCRAVGRPAASPEIRLLTDARSCRHRPLKGNAQRRRCSLVHFRKAVGSWSRHVRFRPGKLRGRMAEAAGELWLWQSVLSLCTRLACLAAVMQLHVLFAIAAVICNMAYRRSLQSRTVDASRRALQSRTVDAEDIHLANTITQKADAILFQQHQQEAGNDVAAPFELSGGGVLSDTLRSRSRQSAGPLGEVAGEKGTTFFTPKASDGPSVASSSHSSSSSSVPTSSCAAGFAVTIMASGWVDHEALLFQQHRAAPWLHVPLKARRSEAADVQGPLADGTLPRCIVAASWCSSAWQQSVFC